MVPALVIPQPEQQDRSACHNGDANTSRSGYNDHLSQSVTSLSNQAPMCLSAHQANKHLHFNLGNSQPPRTARAEGRCSGYHQYANNVQNQYGSYFKNKLYHQRSANPGSFANGANSGGHFGIGRQGHGFDGSPAQNHSFDGGELLFTGFNLNNQPGCMGSHLRQSTPVDDNTQRQFLQLKRELGEVSKDKAVL